jgi:mono/diheme cytochrome c family protein
VCASCHYDGQGRPDRAPLAGSPGVIGDPERPVLALLRGVSGPIEVNGRTYAGGMAAHDWLSDEEVAAVVTYIRQSFGNHAPAITPEFVRQVRARTAGTSPSTP